MPKRDEANPIQVYALLLSLREFYFAKKALNAFGVDVKAEIIASDINCNFTACFDFEARLGF